MKKVALFLIACLLIFYTGVTESGYAPEIPKEFELLKQGMIEEEIIKIVGEPAYTTTYNLGGGKVLIYMIGFYVGNRSKDPFGNSGIDVIPVVLERGKLSKWGALPYARAVAL